MTGFARPRRLRSCSPLLKKSEKRSARGQPGRRRTHSPAEAGPGGEAALPPSRRPPDGDAGPRADRPAVADGDGLLSALGAEADADVVRARQTGRIHRQPGEGSAGGADLVEAPVHLDEAGVHLV